MKDFATIRNLIRDNFFDIEQIRDLIEGAEIDISSSHYRLISADEIDEIMTEELSEDEYMLGCFNAWFLADILGTSADAIEAMQKAEAYEGIGKMILHKDLVHDLQQAYVSADGYGHHFNHYDGSEEKINLSGSSYYLFRTN